MSKSAFLAAVSLMVATIAAGHDLRGGDVFMAPSNAIETSEFFVTFDYSDGSSIKVAPWIDREGFIGDAEFGVYILKNKQSGLQGQYEFILDGGFKPSLEGINEDDYCGVDMLLVTVQRDTPRYGGSASRWLTTYIFRADTFEMLEEFTGTAYDVARFDSRWVPEVDSIMEERYFVSCLAAGRGHPFAFGLIDRKRLYGPDWCRPGNARCEVRAPSP